MASNRHIRRTAPALAGLVAACAAALAAGSPGASAAPKADLLKLEVRSKKLSAVLASGQARARVAATEPGTVKLSLKVGSGPTRARKVGRAKTVEVDSRPETVSFRLDRRSKAALRGCGEKRLVVSARYRPGPGAEAGTPRAKAKAWRTFQVEIPGCVPAAPGGGSPGGAAPGGGGTTPPTTTPAEDFNVIPPESPYTGDPIETANAERCDFLDTAVCLQPWPNDYFTVEDAGTETGRRINLNLQSMPQNAPGGFGTDAKPIDQTDHNRADGFSPGNLIVTKVPGLETQEAFDENGFVSIDHPERYDDPAQKVVVIDADTGERHPVWAEIDSNPADPADVNLMIRPLENFEEGGRYVVAMRNLVDAAGTPIAPADAFRAYRDNLATGMPAVENRREHMEELFEILGDSQIRRSELYLAWDFTVASEESLAGRMLSIRDRAFAGLGDTDLDNGTVEGDAPTFTVDTVTDFTSAEDDRIARQVEGTMTVPCFLTSNCAPAGAQFNFTGSPDGQPVQGPTDTEFTFVCRIPRASLGGPIATGVRPSLYGHGLLGSGTEVGGANVSAMAFEQQMMMCATDWYGFATQNIANIVAILQDLSLFPLLVDGSQQGFLHFLFLGRAMIHTEGGFSDDPAFQDAGGASVIDTSELYYDGNSQGGILGGSLVAVAPDLTRGVLGVPGMNYSTLLRRSVDFEPYAEGQFAEAIGGAAEDAICDQATQIPQPDLSAAVVALCLAGIGTLPEDTPLGLYDNYPDELERPLVLSLMQMLWDRGEANGYAHHMTSEPLPNTPAHEVLLHAAFGDHQVANVTAEVLARTIGASVYQPALDPGRHWEADGSNPIFGIPSIPAFPFTGSALVYWDGGPLGFPGGTATPPNGNVPPRPEDGFGADPHSYPRNDVKARAQKGAFLSPAGTVTNPCGPTPCYSNGYTGPP